MNTFAEVGVLYVYIMLVLLVIGLGFLGFRGLEKVFKWSSEEKQNRITSSKQNQEQPWIRVVFLSATFLFLAVFTLGVLKTIGTGDDDQHSQHHSAASSTTTSLQGYQQNNIYIQQQLQSQINDMSNQINMMEQELYKN